MSSDQLNDENEKNAPALVPAENAMAVKVESEDPIALANRLRYTYHSLQQGYHAELLSVLQEVFRFGNRLERDVLAYVAVTRQRYFQENKLRPKTPTPMKAAVFSTMTPIAETVRDRACKFTQMLELFRRSNLDEDYIAAFIERCGGVDAILANLSKVRAKENLNSDNDVAGPQSSASTKREPDEEIEGGPDEASEGELNKVSSPRAMAASDLMASGDIVSPEQVLYEALTTGEPPSGNRKKRDVISGDSRTNMLVDVGEITLNLARMVAQQAKSPQTYLVSLTISPLDDNGFFHVQGYFEPKIVAGGWIEQPSIAEKVSDHAAMPDANETAGPPAPIPSIEPDDDGSRAEAIVAALPVGEPVVGVTLANPAPRDQTARPSASPKQGSTELLNTLNEPKGTGQTTSGSVIVVESDRRSNKLNSKGLFSQRASSPPSA